MTEITSFFDETLGLQMGNIVELPNEANMASGAIFFTSSGTCSLDLGIPAGAKHPKIMIREYYQSSNAVTISTISDIWKRDMDVTDSGDNLRIRYYILSLDLDSIAVGQHENTLLNHKEEEMLMNLRGKKILLTGAHSDLSILTIESMLQMLSIKPHNNTTFVVGHKNSDPDSAISAIFEALRRNTTKAHSSNIPWIPTLPKELASLLTAEMKYLLLAFPHFKPHHDIILVDCQTSQDGSKSRLLLITTT